MKAIVQRTYGPADVLSLDDIEKPIAGVNEVIVRVMAAGVDPSVWHLMMGEPLIVRLFGFGFRRPKNPVRGFATAGVVESVGANVTTLAVGDEVVGSCSGAFAEFARAQAADLVKKPGILSFVEAAAVPISAITALQALRDAGGLTAGQRVLVIGAAGGVGTWAVQIATAMGAAVTGVCSTSKIDLVRSLGAVEVIDYLTQQLTDADGAFDVILDTAGGRPLAQLRSLLTPTGTIVVVGDEGGGRLFGGLGRGLGGAIGATFRRQKVRNLMAIERASDLTVIVSMIETRSIAPVIDRTFPLAEAADAIRYLQAGNARGKVVLVVAAS
jgi:NADPH:quinone reductase-like Zn-dependent oxidoreductase